MKILSVDFITKQVLVEVDTPQLNKLMADAMDAFWDNLSTAYKGPTQIQQSPSEVVSTPLLADIEKTSVITIEELQKVVFDFVAKGKGGDDIRLQHVKKLLKIDFGVNTLKDLSDIDRVKLYDLLRKTEIPQ